MAENRYVAIEFQVMLPGGEYDEALAEVLDGIEHAIQQTGCDYSEITIRSVPGAPAIRRDGSHETLTEDGEP